MVAVDDLSFRYWRNELFNQLNMRLTAGGIYGLLGRNGAGKTTLLRLLTGLLAPQDGSIRVLGFDPWKRQRAMLEEVFFLPEEFELPPVGLETWAANQAVFYPRFNHSEFDHLLQEFEIPRGANLAEMSFGQKKKFAMAFALACNTSMLILDEPTNAMDIPSKGQFRRILSGVANNERCIVISTHQVRDVETLIDPVIILEHGQVILEASAPQIAAAIHCETLDKLPDDRMLLYSEPVLNGYRVVSQRVDQKAGDNAAVDWEMIFQAATTKPELFRQAVSGVTV